MKNNRFKKILNINRIVFPYLIGLTYFFLFLESYTYIGFLRKFILVDSRFFLVLSIFSVSLLFYLKHSQRNYKSDVLETLVVNLNAVLFLPLVVLYFIMIAANATNYANYVFATYHIQPQNFVNLVYLSLVLLILKFDLAIGIDFLGKYFGDRVKKDSFSYKRNIFPFLMVFLLIFYFVDNLIKTSNRAINDLVFIATHLSYGYDEKMRYKWGDYYDFMKFVKINTPEDSIIVIPPEEEPWLTSGNIWVDRYFLYPRHLVQDDVEKVISGNKGRDIYILVSWGEWECYTPNCMGWPKLNIKADLVLYKKRDSCEIESSVKNVEFKPEEAKGKNGLIKVSL